MNKKYISLSVFFIFSLFTCFFVFSGFLADKTIFLVVAKDNLGKPIDGAQVVLNGEFLGKTDNSGQFEYSLSDKSTKELLFQVEKQEEPNGLYSPYVVKLKPESGKSTIIKATLYQIPSWSYNLQATTNKEKNRENKGKAAKSTDFTLKKELVDKEVNKSLNIKKELVDKEVNKSLNTKKELVDKEVNKSLNTKKELVDKEVKKSLNIKKEDERKKLTVAVRKKNNKARKQTNGGLKVEITKSIRKQRSSFDLMKKIKSEINQGQIQNVKTIIDKATSHHRDYSKALIYIGKFYLTELDKPEKALEFFEKVKIEEPIFERALAKFFVGRQKLSKQKEGFRLLFDEALKEFTSLSLLKEASPKIFYYKALCLQSLWRQKGSDAVAKRARKAWVNFLKHNSKSPFVIKHSSVAERSLGEINSTIKM